MLPLDSPRWANLKICIGNAEEIASEIKEVYDALDAEPRDQERLNTAVEIMLDRFEDLDHQQTTYTAAGAAIPHYVHLLPRLDIASQINLIWMIATLHYDGAGFRLTNPAARSPQKETNFEDLAEWYEESIPRAKQFAIDLAESGEKISGSDFRLFESIANLMGDNSTFYLFRDEYEYEFMCPRCDEDLVAKRGKSSYHVHWNEDESKTVEVSRVESLSEIFDKNLYNEPLLPYYKMMLKGGRTGILDWLSQLAGRFCCPSCKQDSFVAWDDFFRRR